MPAAEPSPSQPNPPARILLVDDDPMVTQLITDMLRLDGHDVDTAPNGVAALEKVKRRRYDLVLSDLHMPEMDGAGLYRELTKRQAHPPGKIIFLTGTAGESEAHRLVQETGLPVLRKPFNLVELLALVRKVLNTPSERQDDRNPPALNG
jgi:DNA-binding response OmpR family regulator